MNISITMVSLFQGSRIFYKKMAGNRYFKKSIIFQYLTCGILSHFSTNLFMKLLAF